MKTIVAIIAIALIEGFAIYQGINGTMLALALVAISGLERYHIKKLPWFK
ncbi:unnamed protein product [marine sediment metagenome]|uniref:Uncharacterized protein n=1 Tax=marine sediment metagenome TaxID=412755 RepID=X1MRN9_9ZZZZ